MKLTLFLLLCPAILLPAISQTFNRLYPSGGNLPVSYMEENSSGYRMIVHNDPTGQLVKFIGIQTDTMGVQILADTVLLSNTPNEGHFTMLSDGYYAFTQETSLSDIKLTKQAADGSVLWWQVYDLPSYLYASPGAVVEGNGGELFIYGYLSNLNTNLGRYYVVKATADGTPLWIKAVSPYTSDIYKPNIQSGASTSDGGFLLAGGFSFNQTKNYLRFDTDGNMQVVASASSHSDHRSLILESSTGKTAFSYSLSTANSNDTIALLRQYDSTNQMDWEVQLEPFDGPGPNFPQQSFITALSPTSDGGYLVAGHGSTESQAPRFFLAKVDSTGLVVWNKYDYGFMAEASYLRTTPEGKIIVAGNKNDHTWLMVADSLGIVGCSPIISNVDAAICEGDSYLIAGQSLTQNGQSTHIFQNQALCDSIVFLNLAVHGVDSNSFSTSFCLGEPSPLTGDIYLQTGNFVEEVVYQNQYGCDSTVTLNAEVYSTIFIEGWAQVPYGEVFLGQVITHSGWYGSTDTSEYGCITIVAMEVWCIIGATEDKLAEQIGLNVSPNPFCNEARIRFKLPTQAEVSAKLFDVHDRLTATLLENETLPPGEHEVYERADSWPSGVYLLQLQVDGQMVTKQLAKICR